MESIARLKDFTFRYPHSGRGLDHVSLTVRPADFIAVAGLTGSGKTTLLRHLKPEAYPGGTRSGGIELLGTAPTNLLGSSEISYVPQRPREALIAGSLRDELLLRLSAHAPSHPAGTADDGLATGLQVSDIVGFLGLAHLLDTPLGNLSEGQAQLVALAAALAARPRLLLLDEPTASLDSVTRRTTLDLLRRLNQDIGMTIVMTEHHLQGVIEIATRLVALEDGTVVADGRPREAIRRLWDGGQHRRALVPDIPGWFLRQEADSQQNVTSRQGETAHRDADLQQAPQQDPQHNRTLRRVRDDNDDNTTMAEHPDGHHSRHPHHLMADRLPLTVSEGRRALDHIGQSFRPHPQQSAHGTVQTRTPDSTNAHAAAATSRSDAADGFIPMATPGSRAFTLSDVTVSYPGLPGPAVEDLTLSARYGEILAITGQSGSGKSTLLNLLFGSIRPDFGTVNWYPDADGAQDARPHDDSPHDKANDRDDRDDGDTDDTTGSADRRETSTDRHTGFLTRLMHHRLQHRPHRRPARLMRGAIAYLPQDVRAVLNLEAGRHPDRIDEVTDPLNQSIGQQQLEALDIIIAQNRRVLLLDEPTQGLDALQKRHVGRLLREQAAQGRLIVLTTHDPGFYADYATRAVVLLAGRLVADGLPRHIVSSLEYSTTDLHRLLADREPGVLTMADLDEPRRLP